MAGSIDLSQFLGQSNAPVDLDGMSFPAQASADMYETAPGTFVAGEDLAREFRECFPEMLPEEESLSPGSVPAVPNLTPAAATITAAPQLYYGGGGGGGAPGPAAAGFRMQDGTMGMNMAMWNSPFAGSTTPQYAHAYGAQGRHRCPPQTAPGEWNAQDNNNNHHHHLYRSDSLSSHHGRKASVPIPRLDSKAKTSASSAAASPTTEAASPPDKGMTVPASGPMSSNIVVPQRPRPGRKPIAPEESVDRRRVQNRLAQRNFRDKRQQKLAETQTQLEQVQKERKEESSEFRRQLQSSREENARLRQQLDEKHIAFLARSRDLDERNQRVAELERLVRELQSNKQPSGFVGGFRNFTSNNYNNNAAATPPHLANPAAYPDAGASPPGDFEVDFTDFGKREYLTSTASNESDAMDYTMTRTDPCGFCTDEQNCACAQEAKHKLKALEPPTTTTAATMPGSCEQCQADPERARACREMAAGTRQAPPELTRSTSSGSVLSTAMPPPSRVKCGTVLDQFRQYGQSPANIRQLFGREMTAYPGSKGGYEFKEAEAAEVLRTLSGSSSGESSQSAESRRESLSVAMGVSRP